MAPLRRQPHSTNCSTTFVHQPPAQDVNIVPSLVDNSLLSTSKFADAGYTTIYDKNEVNFYDTKTTKSQSRRKRYSKDGVAPARIFGVSPRSPLSPTSTRALSS